MTQRGARYLAMQKGEMKYNTGKPCIRGHFADRWTKGGKCIKCAEEERETESYLNSQKMWREQNIEKTQQYNKQWREENKEKKAEKDRQWVINNAERKKENDRKYYEENKDRQREQRTKYAEQNREKAKERAKKWFYENPEAASANSANRRARLKNAGGSFTKEDVKRIFTQQNFVCVGCDKDLKNEKFHVDHIMPLKLKGSNDPTNLQILCPRCNLSKHAKHPDNWIPLKGKKI